jgi:hypothetical protein
MRVAPIYLFSMFCLNWFMPLKVWVMRGAGTGSMVSKEGDCGIEEWVGDGWGRGIIALLS